MKFNNTSNKWANEVGISHIGPTNFHISTKATFRLIAGPDTAPVKWVQLVKSFGLLFVSDSGSQYVTDGTNLWRASNHWGSVATCTWDIVPRPVGNFKVQAVWEEAMRKGPLIGFLRHGPDPYLAIGMVPFSQMKRK